MRVERRIKTIWATKLWGSRLAKAMSEVKYAGCVLDKKDDKKKIMDVMLAQDAVMC